MKRAACLLLLFAVWLVAAPGAAAPPTPARAETVAQGADKASAVQHVVQQLVALPRVPRSPVWARLPALPEVAPRELVRPTHALGAGPRDLREALRRVQTRRRVPRLSSEEPPWS